MTSTTLSAGTADVIRQALGAAQRGDLSAACRIAEDGLAAAAQPAPLHALLGMLRSRAGEREKGITHLEQARRLVPEDRTVLLNLAAALTDAGRHAEVLAEISPREAAADGTGRLWRLRGFAAQQEREFGEAVQAYEKAIQDHPNDWETWNNLGNARTGNGDHDGAVAALRHALELNPASAPTRLNLASALILIGEVEEGETLLRRALAVDPRDKPARMELAALLKRLGREDEVVALLQEGTAADPADPQMQLSLGAEARTAGKHRLAEEALRTALDLSPTLGGAYIHLAALFDTLNREAEIAPLIVHAEAQAVPDGVLNYMRALDHRRAGRFAEALEALDRIEQVDDLARIENLRGQFLDRLGRYDEAFGAFGRGNELMLRDPSAPEARAEQYRSFVRDERDTVTTEWFLNWRDHPLSGDPPSPVFLVGFPRSGTTLLDTILMSHPDVEVLEEEPVMREAFDILGHARGLPDAEPALIDRARASYWKAAGELTPLAPGKLLIDKNPLQMNKLPLIRRLFPDARVILALRHPCDVLLSCFVTNFKLNSGMANFLRLDTAAELYDLSFSSIERAEQVMGIPVHRVTYENIVDDRERELRPLFGFLDLDWRDQVLEHEKTARARTHIKTASYAQVIEPVYKRSAGRWTRYREHLEPIFPVLRPWAEKFGYDL